MVKESTEQLRDHRDHRARLLGNAAMSLLAASDFLRLAARPGELEDFDPAEVWDKNLRGAHIQENLLGAAHSEVGVILSLISELLEPRGEGSGSSLYGHLAGLFANLADCAEKSQREREPEPEPPLN